MVTDPASLVEHVQNGLRLIERKIEEESTGGGPESTADIIVLDDVSPRYTKAVVALQACDARLGDAQRSLGGQGANRHRNGWRGRRVQCIASSALDEPPDFFLACLPLRKRMSISVPLTRTSSHRR